MDSVFMPCFICDGTLVLQSVDPVFDRFGSFKYFLEIFLCNSCGEEFCFRRMMV